MFLFIPTIFHQVNSRKDQQEKKKSKQNNEPCVTATHLWVFIWWTHNSLMGWTSKKDMIMYSFDNWQNTLCGDGKK